MKIRQLLLSDSAYPATLRQVKPYKQNIMLNHSQKKFNKALSLARVTIEHAFGVLKGCWHCLLKQLDNNLGNIPDIILAYCILQNIMQLKADSYIDYDDIIPQEFQISEGRDMGHIHNEVCLESERLHTVLTRYISRDA